MSVMTKDRLRCGIFLPPFHPNDEDPMLCFERDFELIQWLDKLGFHEAWIGDHQRVMIGQRDHAGPESYMFCTLRCGGDE